jgi:hypothetical protein
MKYVLGSKANGAPVALDSVWYPTIAVHNKENSGFKIGEKIKAEVEGVVRSVRQDVQTRDYCYELEIHSLTTKPSVQKSKVEDAGY